MEGDTGQFTIRRMTPADKPALMAIAARIWDGTDYLPAVFDDWVADREGEFAAVLLGGRLVGCGKLTFLTPADAWFEGLRKDPDLAEKGMTTAVSAHFLRTLAGRAGLRSIRFSTYVRNLASITANERMGFRRFITLSCKTWAGKEGELQATRGAPAGGRGLEVRRIDDASLAGRFLEESGYLEATRWLLPDGWRAFPYSRGILAARYVSPGHCWGAFDGPHLAGVMILAQAANRRHLYLKTVVLDAPGPQAAEALLDRLFAVARERTMEYNEIELIAPPLARVLGPCAGRGLRSWEQEEDFLVYEYPGAGGGGPQ